jgi:DNA-binding response OmpR family regulator
MRIDSPLSSSRRPELRDGSAGPAARGYVLVVERDRELRDAVAELLRLEGYGVVGVEDGLDALLQMFTGEPLPDVVIFDADGPGMGDNEFRELLRRNAAAAAVPLLLLASGQALGAGAAATFEKPCRPEALVAAVASATRHLLC